jgi:hypothetical protein
MQISSISSVAGSATSKAHGATKATAQSNELADAGGSSGDSQVVQDFLKYAKMDPMERMRASILKSMNLSDADLAKMSPSQRDAVEQKIAETIQQQLQKNGAKPGSVVDVSA